MLIPCDDSGRVAHHKCLRFSLLDIRINYDQLHETKINYSHTAGARNYEGSDLVSLPHYQFRALNLQKAYLFGNSSYGDPALNRGRTAAGDRTRAALSRYSSPVRCSRHRPSSPVTSPSPRHNKRSRLIAITAGNRSKHKPDQALKGTTVNHCRSDSFCLNF